MICRRSTAPAFDGKANVAQTAQYRTFRCRPRYKPVLHGCDRASVLYKRLGQWNLLGRMFLQKALVCGESGDSEGEMKMLRRSLDLIDPQDDPQVFLAARHNLINALNESGRSREAFALLFHTRPPYLKMGDRMNLLKLRWLEGLVAFGLQRVEQAEAAFREVRQAFMELDLAYDVALVSLDLAAIYARQGRAGEMKRLAAEMLPIFRSHDVHREAIAALLVFKRAAEVEQLTLSVVDEIAAYLERARGDPGLKFRE